jgi:hypothetical protein
VFHFRAITISDSQSLVIKWVLPFISWEDLLGLLLMCIFISGVVAPLIGSVKRDCGKMRKLRNGRRSCLEVKNVWCPSLLDLPESIPRKFILLINSFWILQLLNLSLLW